MTICIISQLSDIIFYMMGMGMWVVVDIPACFHAKQVPSWNKISIFFCREYWLSAGLETKLSTDNRLVKNSEKSSKYRKFLIFR